MLHDENFRLKRYYYVVEGAGLAVPVIVGFLMYIFPDLFLWMMYPKSTITAIAILVVMHSTFFILHEKYRKKIFFSIARYIYALFFMVMIVSTGGLSSPLIFLLMYPLIVSAVYLDETITKRIGLFLTVLLASLIFLYPDAFHDPSALTRHITVTILFGLICYLMHKIVIETLHQKYEKERTDRRLAELTQLEQLKSDFLSTAQHQLRTPLSGLKWALETLKGDTGMATQNQTLIDESIKRIHDAISIVNEMLTTAEGSEANLKLARGTVDVAQLLKEIAGELQYVAYARGVTLTMSVPPRLDIQADEKKLKAALINVVDNALKYSPKGKVSITLSAETPDAAAGTAGARKMKMTVIDNGIGIAKGDLPYIFDRLHRGKNAVAIEPNESGIGLYTAKKIIELHGGSISVSSEIGKGTTVAVILPI